MMEVLLAFGGILLLIALVYAAAKYGDTTKDAKDYELPAPECPRCGKVELVWDELWANEPTARTCSCIRPNTLSWRKWVERCEKMKGW